MGRVQSNGRRGWDAQPDRHYLRRGRKVQASETFIQRLPTKDEQARERAALRRF